MYKFNLGVDPGEYDKFVSSHPLNSLLQTYNWKEIKDNWGSTYVSVTDENEKIVATALILFRKIKGFGSIAYIPRGPILDYEDKALLEFIISNLKKLAKRKKWIFIKMDPKVVLRSFDISEQNDKKEDEKALGIIENLKSLGLVWHGKTLKMSDTFQPRFDATTYLCPNLKAELSSATRQKINRSEKKNVYIRMSDGSYEDLLKFQDILDKTTERKNISLRNIEYFSKMINSYPNDFRLGFAELNVLETKKTLNLKVEDINNQIKEYESRNAPKKLKELSQNKKAIERSLEELDNIKSDKDIIVLSGMLSIVCGDTLEMLYAGFDVRYKSFFAQYLLYLKTMEEAYDEGLKKACMGGIPGTLDDGLLAFKRHFMPKVEEYIGEFDIVVSPLYYPFRLAFRLRNLLRKL